MSLFFAKKKLQFQFKMLSIAIWARATRIERTIS